MNKLSSYTFFLLLFTALLAGCHGNSEKTASTPETTIDYNAAQIPAFDADSAYRYVADQVAFGFRTPGSQGQRKCATYLTSQMRRWCDTVIVQDFPAILWDGREVRGKNIIATVNARPGSPEGRRILLAAHWDSRLWADHDPDENNHRKPFDGANDGASGVGVLMELARAISSQPLSVPVDIIFFDVEDQGVPEWADKYENDSWCKGSQYWSKNPHTPFYTATYGVLLDMVGTQQPRYTKEEILTLYLNMEHRCRHRIWRHLRQQRHRPHPRRPLLRQPPGWHSHGRYSPEYAWHQFLPALAHPWRQHGTRGQKQSPRHRHCASQNPLRRLRREVKKRYRPDQESICPTTLH